MTKDIFDATSADWTRRQEAAARVNNSITVKCPRCHRPAFRLDWDGHHALPNGQVLSESGSVALTTLAPGRRRPDWAPVTISVDAGSDGSGVGRKTFRCTCKTRGRQVRPMQITLTQAQLDTGFLRAAEQGLARGVTWLELQR